MSLKFTQSVFFQRKIHPILCFIPGYDYLLLRKKSYLRDTGWFRSFRNQRSVDSDGNPVPWLTYGAISFLNERVPVNAVIFEYGAGQGTLWWAERTKKITAVEHDGNWFELIRNRMPDNVDLLYRQLNDGYEKSITEMDTLFDIIIVDGRNRVECCKQAVHHLKETGIVILDDTNREKYRPAVDFLVGNGFRKLTFRGFSPIEFMPCETSVFYKEENLLGL